MRFAIIFISVIGTGIELAEMILQIGRGTSLFGGVGGREGVSVIAYIPGRKKGLEDGNSHLSEDHTDHLHKVVFLANGEGFR